LIHSISLHHQWMGILKEIAPAVRRVAFVHVPEITANVAFMRMGEASSAALGMTVSAAGVRNPADIERVLTEFAQEPNGGLIVTPSPLTEGNGPGRSSRRWMPVSPRQ
jgi:putative ABC transport system substrate-binding protein